MEKGFSLAKGSLEDANPLQPAETDVTKEFKAAISESGIDVPAHVPEIYGGELRFYERFLLARDNNVTKATKLLKKCMDIRDSLKVNGNLDKEDLENEKELFRRIKEYWPIEFFGFTKNGNAILFGQLKDIKPKEFMEEFDTNEIKRFYVDFVQEGIQLQKLSNTPPLRRPEENKWKRQVEIYDMNGISMKQLHIKGLLVLKEVLGSGQFLFPENVEKTYVINAPWYFSGAWNVIKHALDKETANKMTISRGDCRKEFIELLGDEGLVDEMMTSIKK
mmetsp:Transcript_20459/g.24786  ORF Transcript_20459/g.24786 Transcript_20459/m.24786 type:complete len:277 (-) Transcript_20459:1050-1880(-)|eukprot:CAMPEP_0204857544 /NCGR_PEP_ID=MMETSP1347-20130617/20838_1 /ASSEMBLY_ACC=CAM_ASM_000690 /TAXON_ID=215587 /ORGANISM="Aplanochytrium stocchinoi, Strain GSBS06" /LENGTH=276 /DNA_ID=CAMNT_0052004987 /DNA_START=45 /DNA_END=875 /DNA_ORIENTATION=+